MTAALDTLLARVDTRLIGGETACLALGRVLEEASTVFGRLTETFAAITAAFSGDALRALSEAVAAARGTVATLAGTLDTECAEINALIGLNGGIAERLDRLRRSVRTIAALATNARVEAARIDSQTGEVSSFALELVGLASRAQKAIDGCCAEQRRLVGTLGTSLDGLAAFRREHQGRLAGVEQALADVALDLDRHRARVIETTSTLGDRARKVTGAVGAVVMALQIGDSTRQRAEHVVDGLAEIGRLDPDGHEGTLRVACRLGADLLDGAHADGRAAFARIDAALLALAAQARDMVDLARGIGATESRLADGFVAEIGGRMGTALELGAIAGAARAQVDGAVAVVVTSTATLETQIETLSDLTSAMTVIGINSVLKARRVGTAGLGLGVIADQLRHCADAVVVDVNLITPALDRLVEATRGVAGLLAVRHQGGEGHRAPAGTAALDAFAAFGRQIEEGLDAVVSGGGAVSGALEAAAESPAAEAGRAAMAATIETLADLADALPDAPLAEAGAAALESAFAARYTMTAERDIHAATLARAGHRGAGDRRAA